MTGPLKGLSTQPSAAPAAQSPAQAKPAAPAQPPRTTALADSRSESERRRLSKLGRELGVLGELLQDPRVSDIWRNPDGSVWVNAVGVGVQRVDYEVTDDVAFSLIGTVSEFVGKAVGPANPILEGVLPSDKSRFSALIPPVSNGGPMFSIRKRAALQRTFDDYVDDGAMSVEQAALIRKRIRARDNFLIVGATGSGKTTLGNAILKEMSEASAPDERFLILEDTPELQCFAPNNVCLLSSPGVMEMNDLLKAIMRHSPTRICVGELRGSEAHTLIKAWNTGHSGGMTTIHAESASRALDRLEDLIREANVEPLKRKVADSVNCIVVIDRDATGKRRIKELVRLTGASDNSYYFSDR